MSNISPKTKMITETAMFLAIAVVAQFIGSQLGGAGSLGQFITGSIVNLCLICSSVLVGRISGLSIAVLSPIIAFLLGVMKVPIAIPVVVIGNAVFVMLCWLTYKLTDNKLDKLVVKSVINIIAVALSACVKAAVMWSLLQFVFNTFLSDKQLGVLSASFSFPQAITGTIAGVIAVILIPTMRKTRKD